MEDQLTRVPDDRRASDSDDRSAGNLGDGLYVRPTVRTIGSVADLTQSLNDLGANDGVTEFSRNSG